MEHIGPRWRKSSYSGTSGNNCVEVATWRKASYSGPDGSNCVEVGTATQVVAVRDTKDRTSPVLRFGPAKWRAFVAGVRNGAFGQDQPGRRR